MPPKFFKSEADSYVTVLRRIDKTAKRLPTAILFVVAAVAAFTALAAFKVKLKLLAAVRALYAALVDHFIVKIDNVMAGRTLYLIAKVVVILIVILVFVIFLIIIIFQSREILVYSVKLFVYLAHGAGDILKNIDNSLDDLILALVLVEACVLRKSLNVSNLF